MKLKLNISRTRGIRFIEPSHHHANCLCFVWAVKLAAKYRWNADVRYLIFFRVHDYVLQCQLSEFLNIVESWFLFQGCDSETPFFVLWKPDFVHWSSILCLGLTSTGIFIKVQRCQK